MCCICIFACSIFAAAMTFMVWCIVAVSENPGLQDEDCPYVAEVWWTVAIMFIVQAANLCVLPCIFGWEQYKMSQDRVYAEKMSMPLTILHCAILASEAFFIAVYGHLAWSGITPECQALLPTDLWVLFQITVVLWTISAVATSCMVCILALIIVGVVPNVVTNQAGAAGAAGGAPDAEREPFVEQNPSQAET